MNRISKRAAVAATAAALAAPALVLADPAVAASARNGTCDSGEFCYYYNSDEKGSISDFSGSLGDYGATQPSCYEFKGAGNGKGKCVKNNAASVWNRTGKTVHVFFNSNYGGASQAFASAAKGNLNATLKNNNASHQVGTTGGGGGSCSTSGLGDPNTCAQAVAWAKNHIGSTSLGVGTCDHVVGLAYGWSNSGSHDAYAHWTQVPAKYKHAGSKTVPAGGLAFFKGGSKGYGHVMLSLGGGKFASTDVGTDGRYHAGRYGTTTIATIESSFGESYLGWTQPWFNH
ncbi:Peptidase inhibitor family I36 [Jatrophihabitans endophyticus]|uniref:Peptidase inhibitor family I36 n=1 Tax=Jatrophihabitans endophyticus TaxID=1206085 RepID=A0A1M5GAQ1_9ACTN|nr:peptidase inhibitor family I36 protein [Jatrophihabitans endophyticus]SHG00890.1 Peptidase inhibitor family I36 [Jatrophihabitans endophyticus]